MAFKLLKILNCTPIKKVEQKDLFTDIMKLAVFGKEGCIKKEFEIPFNFWVFHS